MRPPAGACCVQCILKKTGHERRMVERVLTLLGGEHAGSKPQSATGIYSE
jgi:hypothetical protein